MAHVAVRSLPCIGYISGGFVLFDAASGETLRRFDGLGFIAASPDGTHALVMGPGKERQLVELSSGAVRFAFAEDTYLAAVANGGARVATSVGVSTMVLRDAKGRVARRWFLRSQFASWPALSPDGKLVAVASRRNLRVLGGRAARSTVLPPKSDVYAVAFSPDGKSVIAVGEPCAVFLCKLPSLASTRLEGHLGRVYCAAFSPDGRLAATAGRDASVRLWPLPSGEPRVLGDPRDVPQFHPRDEMEGDADDFDRRTIGSLAFSTDGKTIAATSPRALLVWNVATGKQVGEVARPAAFSGWRCLPGRS